MLSHFEHKTPTRRPSKLQPHSHLPQENRINLIPHTDLQKRNEQTPLVGCGGILGARNNVLMSQNKRNQTQYQPDVLLLISLVQKFIKGIQFQITKSQASSSSNTIPVKLDGLLMHRLKEISSMLPQYKLIQFSPSNPENSPNNAHQLENIHKPNNNTSPSKLKLQQDKRGEQLVRWAQNKKSIGHLASQDLPALFRRVAKANDQLQREKLQLQNQIKKIRLFYLNQIEHYKEEVKFVHQILEYQQNQLKQLQLTSYAKCQALQTVSTAYQKPENNMQETARFTEEEDTHSASGFNESAEQVLHSKEKLLKQCQDLKVQLQQKAEKMTVLQAQISLLEDNLNELSEKVQLKEELLKQKAQVLEQLESQAEMKRGQVSQLQAQLACLRQQAQIQEQNIDYVQQQVDFMEEQRELIAQEIAELTAKKHELTQTSITQLCN